MTDSDVADVAVVGGGPAGAAAATALARAGRRTILVDRARFPRDKICGDGLTTGALRLLAELGVDPTTVPSWQRVDMTVVRGPAGREMEFPLPGGPGVFAAVARRADLDVAVLDRARAAGAEVREGAAVTGTEVRSDRVLLSVEASGPITARYVVAADGMWSPVRKHLGLAVEGYRGEWHAFRQYLSGVTGRAARDLIVAFETDLLPGYWWSFPLPDGGANVGLAVRRDGRRRGRDLAALWPDLLDRPHVRKMLGPDAVAEAPPRSWPIPARLGAVPLIGGEGRILFVGDAAAATDPMTGEGIGQALETGLAAAAAIDRAGPHAPLDAAARYEREVRRGLGRDHRLAEMLVRALAHRRGVRAAMAVAGATPGTRRQFARWLFEAYPRAVLVTPHRWTWPLFHTAGVRFRPELRADPPT